MAQEVVAPLDADVKADQTPTPGGCSGGCACGKVDAGELPELDARAIPHATRHAAIFGALDDIAPGSGLVLVAPHDLVGLLIQLQQRAPDAFEVAYLQLGPEAWRLSLTRKVA
jgi:uncharacterized protein (DUF2249 family)